MMSIVDWSQPDEVLASDDCLVGGDGYFKRKYFHCQFPEFIKNQGLHKIHLLVEELSDKTGSTYDSKVIIANLSSVTIQSD